MQPGTQAAAPTIAEIAGLLQVECAPAIANRSIIGVAAIAGAAPHTLVFASDPHTLANALASAAGLVLYNSELLSADDPADTRLLAVGDPRTAFAQIYHRWFAAAFEPGVDPSALVDATAQVGRGSWIGPGAVLEASVIVGESCQIGPRVVIHQGTKLGDRVIVQAGAVLGSTGFGYVADTAGYLPFPQVGTLWIEDDVEIGANTTIDRGALGETRIGRGTKIDNLVHIAHNCTIGKRVLIAAQVGMAGSTTIGDGAMLGGQVGLGERVTLGPGVVLGGQGGVLPGKELAGKGVYWGTPAQPVREYLRSLARLRRL